MAIVKVGNFSMGWLDIAQAEVKSERISLMPHLSAFEWLIFIIQLWKITWTTKLNGHLAALPEHILDNNDMLCPGHA